MKKKTVVIGGVEYIDATKEATISTIISSCVVVAGISLLIAMSLWSIVENIIL